MTEYTNELDKVDFDSSEKVPELSTPINNCEKISINIRKSKPETQLFLKLIRQNNTKVEDRLAILEKELENCFGPEEPQLICSVSFENNHDISNVKYQYDQNGSKAALEIDEPNLMMNAINETKHCFLNTDTIKTSIVKNLDVSIASKYCQTEFEERDRFVLKCDRECQFEGETCYDFLRACRRVKELEELLENSQQSKLEQVKDLKLMNAEMELKCSELSKSLIKFNEEHDALKDKLKATQLALINVTDENTQIEELKWQNRSLEKHNEELKAFLKQAQYHSNQNCLLIDELKVNTNNLNLQIMNAEGKIKEHEKQKMRLEYELNQTRECLIEKNEYSENQQKIIDQLETEIGLLKQEQQNFNFKKFVTLRRELDALKQEMYLSGNIDKQKFKEAKLLPPIKQLNKEMLNLFDKICKNS
jgi:hypothetical protein